MLKSKLSCIIIQNNLQCGFLSMTHVYIQTQRNISFAADVTFAVILFKFALV